MCGARLGVRCWICRLEHCMGIHRSSVPWLIGRGVYTSIDRRKVALPGMRVLRVAGVCWFVLVMTTGCVARADALSTPPRTTPCSAGSKVTIGKADGCLLLAAHGNGMRIAGPVRVPGKYMTFFWDYSCLKGLRETYIGIGRV